MLKINRIKRNSVTVLQLFLDLIIFFRKGTHPESAVFCSFFWIPKKNVVILRQI